MSLFEDLRDNMKVAPYVFSLIFDMQIFFE